MDPLSEEVECYRSNILKYEPARTIYLQHLTELCSAACHIHHLQHQARTVEKRPLQSQRAEKHAQREAEKQIELYARASCRDLCRMVQEKLPRELRDEIYQYITTSTNVRVYNEGPIPFTPTHPYSEDPSHHEIMNPEYRQHYWDTDFIGQQTRMELAEYHYRTACFSFKTRSVCVITPIEKFLQIDHLGLRFPPSKYLSKVELSFWAQDLFHRSLVKQDILQDMEDLFHLKTGATVSFKLSQVMDCDSDDMYSPVKESVTTIFPITSRLNKARYNVTVRVDAHFHDGCSTTTVLMPRNMDFSVETWIANLQEVCSTSATDFGFRYWARLIATAY